MGRAARLSISDQRLVIGDQGCDKTNAHYATLEGRGPIA